MGDSDVSEFGRPRFDSGVGKIPWRREAYPLHYSYLENFIGSRLNGHEFKQTSGDSESLGSLECYSPWGHKRDVT